MAWMKALLVLPMIYAVWLQHSPLVAGELEPLPGWYYFWTLCPQEPAISEAPPLCDAGLEGEASQAMAVSNVFHGEAGYDEEYESFKKEVTRRFGFEPPIPAEGPFASFAQAEAELIATLRANRREQDGRLAVTAILLGHQRPENDQGNRVAMPPAVMAIFQGGSARLRRDAEERTCGLYLADGTIVRPDLVADLWGEQGEGCPRELAQGSGIYRFDVPRSGEICGATGICTELFDSEGQWLGVVEESPDPVISGELLQNWGIIRTGHWNHRLYSIPERRILFQRWPGESPEAASRVVVGEYRKINGRPAIEIRRLHRERVPEIGVFWLDTMSFALASDADTEANPVQRNAVGMADRVCLAPRSAYSSSSAREGPCTKALIALERAGLKDSLIFADVSETLSRISATRKAGKE